VASPVCHVVFFFVRPVFQSFLIAVFLHLAGGWKKVQGTPAWKKSAGGLPLGQKDIHSIL
jgi:hypothetical protein